MFKVSDIDKMAIRNDPSPTLIQWTTRLQQRFHPRMAQAVCELQELMYQVDDVQKEQSVVSYMQSKVL